MGGGERAPHVCGHHSYPQLAHRPVGQKISKIYRERIGQFYSRGQWDKVNLLSYVFWWKGPWRLQRATMYDVLTRPA